MGSLSKWGERPTLQHQEPFPALAWRSARKADPLVETAETPPPSTAVDEGVLPHLFAQPRTLWFAQERRLLGGKRLLAALLCWAAGGYLFSQLGTAPVVDKYLILLGIASLVGGLVYLACALHDLFGRLVIDQEGVALRTATYRFRIGWCELHQWHVAPDGDLWRGDAQLLLWKHEAELPCVLRPAFFSSRDCHWLVRALQQVLPLV